ncbi:proteasome subunit beta type-3-like [Drosophila tropicalis]|uniref:proteasome subunit beta type-3-like n=1 Tax=Drosophila tropicalis TaxID=46794 RepID=UPI0035AC1051
MSSVSLNAGCVVAMLGKDCVALATDHRFGIEALTMSTDYKKAYHIAPRMYLGMTGLPIDILMVRDRVLFRKNLYELRENREMSPKPFSSMLSSFLFEHRFGPYYVEPVVAALDPKTLKPFICNMDLIGCINESDDYVVAGTCTEQLYGMCETLWRPNLDPEELFEVIAKSIVNAFDRDAMSGWGATVFVIEKDKITERALKTRMD